MRVSDVRSRVLATFGDTDNIQILDEDIIRWVNDAQREICTKFELLQVSATHDLVGLEDTYELPDQVYKVYSVVLNDKGLMQIQIQDMPDYEKLDPGTPTSFLIWDQKLVLIPKPATSKAGGLKIYYIRFPEPVSAIDQELRLPPEYFSYINDYTLSQAYLLDNDKDGYMLMQSKLNERFVDVYNDRVDDQANEYPQIREVFDAY